MALRTNIRDEKLDFWKAKGKNALFNGPTGVGKTQMVLDCMKRNGLSLDTNVAQWSTPLLDFVGVKAEDADVLFFDDFADEKAHQAAKEIISLRRWKGKEIKPTAVVWACYTMPWDETGEDYVYLSKTVAEVFEIDVSVPRRPNESYFIDKFNKDITDKAVQWWDDLPEEEKRKVTPSRLEQALDMWAVKGDMRDVLPVTANVAKLTQAMNSGPMEERLKQLFTEDDNTKRLFFSNENNFGMAFKYVCNSDAYMRAFLRCFSKEKLSVIMDDKMYGDKIAAYIIVQSKTVPLFYEVCKAILQANSNKRLVKKMRRMLLEINPVGTVSETPQQ